MKKEDVNLRICLFCKYFDYSYELDSWICKYGGKVKTIEDTDTPACEHYEYNPIEYEEVEENEEGRTAEKVEA